MNEGRLPGGFRVQGSGFRVRVGMGHVPGERWQHVSMAPQTRPYKHKKGHGSATERVHVSDTCLCHRCICHGVPDGRVGLLDAWLHPNLCHDLVRVLPPRCLRAGDVEPQKKLRRQVHIGRRTLCGREDRSSLGSVPKTQRQHKDVADVATCSASPTEAHMHRRARAWTA
eukprot:352030-Chlamydomonas_euryale.AAC.1